MKIISVLSAWGMFLVVLGHSSPPPAGDIWVPEIWTYFNELIYCFHMPLFAFISGICFFLFSNYKGYMDLILHKGKRLLIPYFFWMSFIFFLKVLFSGFAQHPIPLDFQLLLHHWLYPKNAIVSYYWFLLVIFFIFLLYPIFQLAKKSMAKTWEVIITFIFLLLYLYNPWGDYRFLSMNRIFDLLIYFWLGILVAKHCLCLSKSKYYVLGSILLLGVGLGKTGIWSDAIYRFVLAITGIYVSWGGCLSI